MYSHDAAPKPGLSFRFTGEELICATCGATTPRQKPLSHHADCPEAAGIGGLSRRQLEVARLLSEGCSQGEIAERLGVSASTIYSHVWCIRKHLGERRIGRIMRMYIEYEMTHAENPKAGAA